MPGESFSPFPQTTSATTKQRHQKSSSSSASHSPHSDSALLLHTPANSAKQQENRQRPVSVPPTIGPGIIAESDGTEARGAAAATFAMNFLSEKSSTASALLGRRQPTIDEENEREEEEEPISMPDFGAAVTAFVSDFGGCVKSETHEEVIVLESDGHRSGKAMRDGSECREGTAAEGTVAVHPTHLKREEEDAVEADQRRPREEIEGAELGADAAALRARRAARQQRREPVVVGWRTLERAMCTKAEDSDMSPLEQFLLGSTLLSRLCSFFEMVFADPQRYRTKLNLVLKDYGVGADGVMNATFLSFPMPSPLASAPLPSALGSPGDHGAPHNQQFHPSTLCLVRLQLFVCPQQFRLVSVLDYTGSQCPAESDVRIFERFFAREIVRMNNELAVFTFVTLCRICHPPIFASFAQLMMAQMEPQPRWPWRVRLELVHITEEVPQVTETSQQQQQQKIQKIVKSSLQAPDYCKRIAFNILLKPKWQNGGRQPTQQPPHEAKTTAQQQTNDGERRIILHYAVDHDELTLPDAYKHQQQMSLEECDAVGIVLKTQTELCRQQSAADSSIHQQQRRVCCIWPCIRALLEGQHQQPNVQQLIPPMEMQQTQGSAMDLLY